MANLQIKGMDDELYKELKKIAAEEKRSISQQTLLLVKDYLARKQQVRKLKTPAQLLLELSGSWEDNRGAEAIVSGIKKARKNMKRLRRGF
jgi:predicted CopG family antitoxin